LSHLLIIDDEPGIARLLHRSFSAEGYEVLSTSDPEQGLALLKQHPIDIIITDLCMPDTDGLEVLRRSKLIRPGVEVVMITAFATVDTAREAMKRGAVDYLTKPFSIQDELKPLIENILKESPQSDSTEEASPGTWSSGTDVGETKDISETQVNKTAASDESTIIAEDEAMLELLERAKRVARSDVSVLLTGKSGTGKDVVARAIHRHSSRSDRPLISINCASLPDTLLESELFGHTKGAFTGAVSDRPGFFEAANGGTIFLDEIGEISRNFQPKLLRVLENGEFHRIGNAKQVIKVDVRIIAATNLDLERAILTGNFREDLYYRLNVVPLHIPSLQERPDDIPALIQFFLDRADSGHKLSRDAEDALLRYEWPGNVRELRNAMEHGIILSDKLEIQLSDLPAAIQDDHRANAPKKSQLQDQDQAGTLEEIEIGCIMQAMAKTGHNRTQAADLLGVSRRTLGYRIEKYGLTERLIQVRRASMMKSTRSLSDLPRAAAGDKSNPEPSNS
jgi:DNA-binding NtrC family response regulator